jgi:hypothetical protein
MQQRLNVYQAKVAKSYHICNLILANTSKKALYFIFIHFSPIFLWLFQIKYILLQMFKWKKTQMGDFKG